MTAIGGADLGAVSSRSDRVVVSWPLAAAPTDVSAVAGARQASVTWAAPANASDSGVTGYQVRWFAGDSTTATSSTLVGAPDLSTTVNGSTPDTEYSFDVTAIGPGGDGATSARTNRVAVSWPLALAPTDLQSTGGARRASVSWTAPGTAEAAGVSGYRVRWFSGSGTAALGSLEVGASARSATVTGLTSGAAYTFDVSATGPAGAGTVSQRSAQVTPTANAVRPGKVRIGKAQAGAAGGTVTATARWTRWTSSAVTGYGVTALGLNAQGGVVSRTVSALLPPAGAASA